MPDEKDTLTTINVREFLTPMEVRVIADYLQENMGELYSRSDSDRTWAIRRLWTFLGTELEEKAKG